MSDRPDIWKIADQLQMNHRTMGAQIVELRAMMAALDLPPGRKPQRAGSPHELAEGCCPTCHVGAGQHAEDCEYE